MTSKKFLLIAVALLVFACGGSDTTTTPQPQHVDKVVHAWHADGSESTTIEDVVADVVSEPQPQDDQADADQDYGQTAEAITVPSQYGTLMPTPNSNDGRCPTTTWSAPNYCTVPPTKSLNIISVLAADHSAANTEMQGAVNTAIAFFGNAYIEGNPREFRTSSSGPATVLVRSMVTGDCGITDLACTIFYTSSSQAFTVGGKPYRKAILLANPHGDVVYYTIYVNSAQVQAHGWTNVPNGTQAQKQAAVLNFEKNSFLHEWGHATGLAHNPGSPIMKNGGTAFFYSPDTLYADAETAARLTYIP